MDRKSVAEHSLYPSYVYGRILYSSREPKALENLEELLTSQVKDIKWEDYHEFKYYHWWDDEDLLIASDGWKSYEKVLEYRVEKAVLVSTVSDKNFIGVFSGVQDVIFHMGSALRKELEEKFGIKLHDFSVTMDLDFVKRLASSGKVEVSGVRYSDGSADYYVKRLPEKSLNVNEFVTALEKSSRKVEVYSLGLYFDKDAVFLDKDANLMFPDSSLSTKSVSEITYKLLRLL